MRELVVTHDSSAGPEQVWSVLTDLDNAAVAISAIEKVERLDGGGGFELGTTWRETRTMFGKKATEDMTVTELEPGRSYTTEARSHGAHYLSTNRVEPIEGGSRITVTFGAEPTSAISKVFAATIGRLFDNATRKALAKDLTEIAAAAERSS
ncbi:MAG: SRPBCC family protein [Acidimicrobiia bacterium]|nr:SRPBCC family protein [Acidimicrobiia bacterium]